MVNRKYGAHIYIWTDSWSNEKLDLFDRAKSLGLDCLEIAVGDNVDFDAEAARLMAEETGMDIVLSPGGEWPMHLDISDECKENRKDAVDWHKHWITKAGECNARAYTGAIYGHPGVIRYRKPTEEELKRTAEGLFELAEHSKQNDVILVIEPMSHFRTHLVNTPDQALEMIKRTGHQQLKILFDTYHAVTEIRDFGQAIRDVREHLWGVHVCENDRGVPGGGIVPWDKIFSELNTIESELYFIMESYNSSVDDFAISRGMFHNVCPDGDEFIRKGLEFITTM